MLERQRLQPESKLQPHLFFLMTPIEPLQQKKHDMPICFTVKQEEVKIRDLETDAWFTFKSCFKPCPCIFYKPFYCLKNKPQVASVMESNLFTQQILSTYYMHIASLVAQRLKCLPPMRETRVRSLGWEDPLEKEMVTHSSILAWRMPWTEEPGRLQSTGSQRVGHDWLTSLHFTSYAHHWNWHRMGWGDGESRVKDGFYKSSQ